MHGDGAQRVQAGPLALAERDRCAEGAPHGNRLRVMVAVHVGDEELAHVTEAVADLAQ